MPFNMNFNREDLSGLPPVPDGWYTLQLKDFKPKVAGQLKDSISLNPEIIIIGHPEYNDRRVWENLNMKAGWVIQDLVHACGLAMEEVPNSHSGTEAAEYTLPGAWEGLSENPDDPSKWKYRGPLTNKTFTAELYTSEWQGKKSNKVRQYKCAVQGCTEKHSTNLAPKS